MSGATISTNAKTPDGTLHSVGGVGFDDFHANLVGLYGGDAAAVEDVLSAMRASFTPTAAGGTAAAVAAVTHAFPQAQPVQQVKGDAPSCHHGAKVLREGGGGNTGKKEWKAWMCPSPKGTPDQCPAEWVR